MDYHAFSSLSTVDLKEILHKRQIDSTGIYDREALIQLAMGKTQHVNHKIQIPQSYIELFEVENQRKDAAEERIREYLKKVPQATTSNPSSLLQQDDRTVMTVVENMPAKYKEDEILRFLSRAGEVDFMQLKDIDDTTINPRLQTRTVLVSYKSKQSAKRCKELFNGLEVVKGIYLMVLREMRVARQQPNRQNETLAGGRSEKVEDPSHVVATLYNMFVEKHVHDRQYMQEMREDAEEQCSEYGQITGFAIDEQQKTVMIRYSSALEALRCKNALDGKLFDGRRISVKLSKDEYTQPKTGVEERSQTENEMANPDDLFNDFLATIAQEEARFK